MGNHDRFSTQKRAKDGKKYVDYRKKFKYSVSDGSILAYYNGADYTFTWEQGRQLASVTKGNKTASYTYDMSGVRSGKVVNGVSYEYTTLSGKITRMTWSGNAVDIVYDDAGRPYILRYTPSGGATQTYYYVLNLQGDVVGLMNTSMQMVVKYSYDPWGKLTGTTATSAYVALAQANPLRYRSYCYDIETGFYYLQTRYYDPAIARFINADSCLTTNSLGLLSYNMFAYCENNPVMRSDPTGEWFWDILDIVMAAASWNDFIEETTVENFGWALLDTVALLPVVPSTGYARRGADLALTAVSAAKKSSEAKTLLYSATYGIDTYNNLRKVTKGTRLERHHIVEKRLANVLNVKPGDMLSVVLTPEEHQIFTKRWREQIPYGTAYEELTKADIWNAAKKVYYDYPDLLEIAKQTIFET